MYSGYYNRPRSAFYPTYPGYGYGYPGYGYSYPYYNNIGSQSSNINQQIYNAGVMAGVSQSAISNNIRY